MSGPPHTIPEILEDLETSEPVVEIVPIGSSIKIHLDKTEEEVVVDGLDHICPALAGFVENDSIAFVGIENKGRGSVVSLRDKGE